MTKNGRALLTKGYPLEYPLQWFLPKPSHGGFGIFSTGTYMGIGTMCVESEICYEKYYGKKRI